MRKTVLAIAGLTFAGALIGFGVAEPSTASVCGFYEDARTAYYNHCAENWVEIHVDKENWGPFNDEEYCVRPGVTGLGSAEEVINAYYISTDCPW